MRKGVFAFSDSCRLAFKPLSVKMRLERPAGRDKREIINNFSSDDAQSNAERIFNRPTPGKGDCSKVPYDTQGVLNN